MEVLRGARAYSAVYTPLVAFLAWTFLLTWYYRALTVGFGLLGYRAWASKESVDNLGEATKTTYRAVKKGARRMTMGAGDLVRMASGSKAKEN